MVDIVIEYDKTKQEYKVYEPGTDTLIVTSNLSESFLNLSNFLKSQGLITGDILNTDQVTYHIDSPTFIAMVESNVKLLKRLNQNQGTSSFQNSSRKFGVSPGSDPKKKSQGEFSHGKKNFSRSRFSKSNFRDSYKKFN